MLKIEDTEEVNPHWYTCTHRMDLLELIREAEGCAVFQDFQKLVVHISVRHSQWYSCKVIPYEVYHELTEMELMQLVYEITQDLKSLQA